MNRNAVSAALLAVVSGAIAAPASLAQTAPSYPSKPVAIIVPAVAGGGVDLGARLIAGHLGSVWGKPFVVQNITGVSTIGTLAVAKAAPDGHTLGMVSVTHAVSNSIYKDVPYDPVKSFEPIVLAYVVPHVLQVTNSLPARTLPELIALLKANPGKYNFSSGGVGNLTHLEGELFRMQAGVSITHVPYKGSIPSQTDLIAGRIEMAFDGAINAFPQVKAGKLRALAVTTRSRVSSMPDVPTMIEGGLKAFETSSWVGMLAPAGTPRDIVAKLNAEINKGLAVPELAKKINDTGAEIAGGSPQAFGELVAREVKQWAAVAQAAGIKPGDAQ